MRYGPEKTKRKLADCSVGAIARCVRRATLAVCVMPVLLAACDGHGDGALASAQADTAAHGGKSRAEVYASVRKMTALGKQIFFDKSLSGSGKLACATCHSPDHAFGPSNNLAVQLGGNDMHRQGMRAVPSLKYLQAVPPFSEHYHDSDDDGDESVDAGPTGGLTWDGRVDRGSAQARIPLLSSFEMASTPHTVAAA